MTTTPQQTRSWTDIDRLAEAHLDASVALSPLLATYLGVPGADDQIDDLSVEGLRAQRDLCAETWSSTDGSPSTSASSRRPPWTSATSST